MSDTSWRYLHCSINISFVIDNYLKASFKIWNYILYELELSRRRVMDTAGRFRVTRMSLVVWHNASSYRVYCGLWFVVVIVQSVLSLFWNIFVLKKNRQSLWIHILKFMANIIILHCCNDGYCISFHNNIFFIYS